MRTILSCLGVAVLSSLILASPGLAQQSDPPVSQELFESLELRNVGPSLTTGRISDVAIDPRNRSVWYVGVSSGNVWKTVNRGTTWEPIFDDYGSYSIGAVTIDQDNPDVVWVGTGENASQRSAGYGDGIYKTTDGGESWAHMGLPNSEHIGDILIDPRNSDVVYAASQGPLWSSGGDRGLYKTTNGGESWDRILHVSDDTGIADIVFHPTNPDIIYAASYQRRRHVGLLVAGGPEATIFKSTDAGASWTEISDGLPAVDLGRIALEVSPHDPNVVYALVAAQHDESGFFRSSNRGESWVKTSDYIVVDPQYYGELFADPHRQGRICAVDVTIHCTEDDGETFEPLPLRGVHSDHHEIIYDPVDPNYMMVGNDGGLYETWDSAETWMHHANLPIVQFYRVGVSDDLPFYWVYGGTQDNGTLGGPSRTLNRVGIRDAEWTRIIGGDGFQVRIDPRDPNIVYGMSQGARLARVNMKTGVSTSIAPPDATPSGETILWHWDIPLVISQHDSDRVYALGSHLLRSDRQGEDWQILTGNLSRQIDRDTLPVMGRIWPDDAVWKNVYTNDYGIGVSFSESVFDQNLLYVGTDDGLIQVSEDGGATWRKIDSFPGIPELIYVSDVVASRHNPDRVYALFNNHKRGDFTPYVLRSDDRGRSWTSVAATLPGRHALWSIIEDPVNEDLLFLGSELGLFFTVDAGDQWIRIEGNAPTIPFRDLEIQEREGDLVAATFGRGFFILDDYAPLRQISAEMLSEEVVLFPTRPTPVYDEIGYVLNGYGAGDYAAPNPPFGVPVTYYLREAFEDAEVVVTVTDGEGTVLAEMEGPNRAGVQRVTWNLRAQPEAEPGERPRGRGPLVEPGRYEVTVGIRIGESVTSVTPSQTVRVIPLPESNRD